MLSGLALLFSLLGLARHQEFVLLCLFLGHELDAHRVKSLVDLKGSLVHQVQVGLQVRVYARLDFLESEHRQEGTHVTCQRENRGFDFGNGGLDGAVLVLVGVLQDVGQQAQEQFQALQQRLVFVLLNDCLETRDELLRSRLLIL